MKKFIRSKMDHIEIINRAAPDPPPPPNISISEQTRSEVQPPLPLGPPPPDEYYSLHVKQEIVDDEYETNANKSTASELQTPLKNCENSTHTPEQPKVSKVPICRDYVRGTCKRPGTCKYAHNYDVTQLVGVYTFCRNYQTSVCTYPNCKYVHATVFEEQHFYKTGNLPPQVFDHYNNVDVMHPPTRQPPTNLSVNTNVSMNSTFTNLPPPLQNEIFQEDIRNNGAPRSATLKRQWNSIQETSNSPSDRDSNEPFTKKCKHCDIMDFRLLYNKYKVEKKLLAKERLNKKIFLLEKTSAKLRTIISQLLSKPKAHNNRLGSSLDNVKHKTLLEQLNNIFTVSNRPFAFEEEIIITFKDSADDSLGGVTRAPKLWLW